MGGSNATINPSVNGNFDANRIIGYIDGMPNDFALNPTTVTTNRSNGSGGLDGILEIAIVQAIFISIGKINNR
jgi:hypothetical protein